MKDLDIIILALPRWNGTYASTSQSIASELAQTHRVFYIDNPFTWKDFLKRFYSNQIQRRISPLLFGRKPYQVDKKLPSNLVVVTPRLVIPVKFLSPGPLYNAVSRINDRIVSRSINRCIRDYHVEKYLFINSFNPFYRFTPSRVRPKTFIYQCVDDISEHPYVSKHGPWLEAEMISQADVVLVTSRELFRLKRGAGDKVVFLPNAANASVFQAVLGLRRPVDVPDGYQGIIGYVGNIDPRLDYELLVKVANYFPRHLLLIVGPKTFAEYKSFGLDQLPNVCFVGAKPYQDLPGYLNTFDCAIIPFKCNAATRSIYPLKVNEYLASGKPVVSTNFSEDIGSFRDTVAIADTHDAFVTLIGKEIESDSDERRSLRRSVAKSNTWQARVKEFWKIIDGLEK